MNWATLIKSKTFWAGVSGLIAAIGGVSTGEMSIDTGIQTALIAALGIFGRDAIAKMGNGSGKQTNQYTPKPPCSGPDCGCVEMDGNGE